MYFDDQKNSIFIQGEKENKGFLCKNYNNMEQALQNISSFIKKIYNKEVNILED